MSQDRKLSAEEVELIRKMSRLVGHEVTLEEAIAMRDKLQKKKQDKRRYSNE